MYLKNLAAGLKPEPVFNLSDWADENRVLTSEFSSEPGKFRTSRFPFIREIQDMLSPSCPTQHVVVVKSTQMALTTVAENMALMVADKGLGALLWVSATVDFARRISGKRFGPTIKAMPCLKGKIKNNRSRDGGNTILSKDFPGGNLRFCGANSESGLRGDSVRFLVLDDRSAYVPDLDGKGEPGEIVKKRTDNFPNKKIYENSTPTIEGICKITEAYKLSSQAEYHIPCPDCGHFQTLQWGRIKFKRDQNGMVIDKSIFCECENCQNPIYERQKTKFLQAGKWVHAFPERKIKGYKINSLYSPLGFVPWEQIITEFIEANDALKRNDSSLMKVWENNRMTQTSKEEGQEIDSVKLYERREDYGPEVVPEGGLVLTCGVDVQGDRIELEVVAWGEGFESWSIDYQIFRGETSNNIVWRQLSDFLRQKRYGNFKINCTAIDSGFLPDQVYKFVASYKQYFRVFAIKGMAGGDKTRAIISKKPTKTNKYNAPLHIVGSDTTKDLLFQRLSLEEPGPGFCHFPAFYDMDYFDMLTSEICRIKYIRGFPVREYIKKTSHARNEALDVRCYNIAAITHLNPVFPAIKRRLKTIDNVPHGTIEIEAVEINTPEENIKKKTKKKRKSGFMEGYK